LLYKPGSVENDLFVSLDWHYVITFCLFCLSLGVLIFAFTISEKKAMQAKDSNHFDIIRLRAGILVGLLVALYWIFNDYNASSMDRASIVGTVVVSILAGLFASHSIKAPQSRSSQIQS
jgi:hypothetical protein